MKPFPHASCPQCHGNVQLTCDGLHCPECDWREWADYTRTLLPPMLVTHALYAMALRRPGECIHAACIRTLICSIGPDAKGRLTTTRIPLN